MIFPQEEHTKKPLKSQVSHMHLAALLVCSMDSPCRRLAADGGALAELGWGGKAAQHPSKSLNIGMRISSERPSVTAWVVWLGKELWGDIEGHWSLLRPALRVFSQMR